MNPEINLRQTLENLGYPIKMGSGYWQSRAVYRDGQDSTSVAIYPQNNLVIDFVTGEKFSIEDLIGKTLKLNSDEVLEWFKNKNISLPKLTIPNELKIPEIFSQDFLLKIEPNHEYVISRGISQITAEKFRGGVVRSGKLKDRYVWPIFNSREQIVGFTGRDLTNKKKTKYIHFGFKSNWCWPCFLNHQKIRESVILVESPMDVMTLFECGVENGVCLFGIDIGLGLLNLLLKLNTQKIIIATNNDVNNVGQEASQKLKRRLSKYFDTWNIEIKLPPMKDLNECLINRGRDGIIEVYG